MEGWIKLHRSILLKGWVNKSDFVQVWIHLLLMATHKDREYFWNGKTIVLKSGQLITGRKSISEKTGVDENKVERILKVFESEQQIEQRKTSTSRLISILNWEKYQEDEQPFEQRVNNGRTTSEQRVNTKQELKNDKNDKNERRVSAFTPPTPEQVRDYFFEIGVGGNEFERFHDHYTANGWTIGGRTKMKDWKAACRNWKKNINQFSKKNDTTKPTAEERSNFYREYIKNA